MSVDRMPARETNIRMMTFLNKGHARTALQEGFRMKQKDNAGRVRDTSRKEKESRSGWSVGQDGQDVSG